MLVLMPVSAKGSWRLVNDPFSKEIAPGESGGFKLSRGM